MTRARTRARTWLALLLIVSAWAGCRCPAYVPPEGDDGGSDAGVSDGGPTGGGDDGGGASGSDGGATGGDADAGTTDAGTGGSFDAGMCPPRYTGFGTELGSGLQTPRRVAVDDTGVYVSEAGRVSRSDGLVLRIPIGSGTTQPLASNLQSPDALAVDATAVYVLTFDGLTRIDKSTGQAQVIDPVQNAAVLGGTEVVLTDTAAVVATGLRWLRKVNKDGTGGVDLYAGPSGAIVTSVAIDQGQAYFLVTNAGSDAGTQSGLYQVPVDGSAAAQPVRPDPASGNTLLVTATDFIWAEGSNGGGAIRKASRSGGPAVDLATGLTNPSRLAVVGNTLYFKDRVLGGNGFFRYLSLCEPGTSFPVGPVGDGPGDVVSGPAGLYYSSQGSSPAGYVARLP